MATIRLRYIQRFKDRHGTERLYFRKPGSPRVPLPGALGSREFMEAYRRAVEGEPPKEPPKQAAPGSIDALAAAYYRSTEFKGLAASTQRTYRNLIEAFRKENGTKRVAALEKKHIRNMVAARAERPSAANALLKILRILCAFAIEEGLLHENPTVGVKRAKVQSEGWTTWTEDDIAAFEVRWPLGTRQHLALMLMLYTGQRGRSDVARMGPQHVQGNRIAVQQCKTRARLTIPLHPRLRAAIDACPSGHLTFIATDAGKPYAGASFGNWFADAVRAAGLNGIAAHGLRKGCARRLAEAGCTPHEIMAILGHKTLKEVARYTQAMDQAGRAEAAIAKLPV